MLQCRPDAVTALISCCSGLPCFCYRNPMIALALGTHRLEMPCWSGEMPLQPALVPCYRGDVTGVAMLPSADSMTSRGDSMTLRS